MFDEKIIMLIHKAVLRETPAQDILQKVRDVIQDIPDFNIREKAKLYVAAKKLVYRMQSRAGYPDNGDIKKFCTAYNKISEHRNSRQRKENLKLQLRSGRGKHGVFYLVSAHSNPACGHADIQGTVLVDRFWRNTLKDDAKLSRAVQAYINNHDILTVQEMTGEPVFLITRPYCKHYLIPLDTDEVLHGSLNSIRKKHPEYQMRTQNINYRKKFYQKRRRIHTVLGMQGEAKRDSILIKKAQK